MRKQMHLKCSLGHNYTLGTLDALQACDACADMGMAYSVVQYADCVVFPSLGLVECTAHYCAMDAMCGFCSQHNLLTVMQLD